MTLFRFFSWLPELLVLLGTMLVVAYMYFKVKHGYWKRKGMPYLEPSFPGGNVWNVMTLRTNFAECLRRLYEESEGKTAVGFYMLHKPALLVRDPDLLRTILVKDFNYIMDRGFYANEEQDFMLGILFFLPGAKWRNMRAKLSPTFTSGKMRMMFSQIAHCGKLLAETAPSGKVTELRELVSCYGTDVIASCAFGVEANSQRNPDADFRQWGRRFFEPNMHTFLVQTVSFVAPKLRELLGSLGLRLVPGDISEYFSQVIRENVEYREKNGVTRNDFLQLLIQLRNHGYVEEDSSFNKNASGLDNGVTNETNDNKAAARHKKLTFEEMTAQAFVFFLAGFETSSTTESFALYEMALHPEVQEKLRAEVDSVLKETDGEVTYEAVTTKMPYMDMVIAETLRKYPSVPLLNREVTQDYRLPGFDCVLEKGTAVVVPLMGLHYDPKYFPDPERFDPERFSEENKSTFPTYAYLPFGEGPRICIGMRFAQLQVKVCLANLLSKFVFEPCPETPKTIRLSPQGLTFNPAGGLPVMIRRRADVLG